MTILFKASTNEGHIIKALSELLQHNIQDGCYKIDKKGLTLKMLDKNEKILFSVTMLGEYFQRYDYKLNTDFLYFGINQSHFCKLLKSIKKKDSVSLEIDEDSPNDLKIQIVPKEKNRSSTFTLKTQNIQNININSPKGYDSRPIIVPSSDYQKMCKTMNSIGNSIRIQSNENQIKFFCDKEGIYTNEQVFGDSDDKKKKMLYSQDFDIEQLFKISKIASLSGSGGNIQIYQKKGLPLLLRTNVGSLGKISVYIKTKDQCEEDQKPEKSPSSPKEKNSKKGRKKKT